MGDITYLYPLKYTGQVATIPGVPGVTPPIQIADHTSYIQNAINNVTAAGGGTIYFTSGNYTISSSLIINSYIVFQGASDRSSNITITSTTQDCFAGVDVTDVSFRDLILNGPGSGTGKGINLTRSVNQALPYLNFSNLRVQSFGSDGIALSNPIVTTFSRVISAVNGGYGFNLFGVPAGAAGTSVSFDACYGNGNSTGGYRLFNMVYTSLSGCATDSTPIGYLIDTCQSVALSGCGGEANTTNTYKITGGFGITLTSCWVYNNKSVAVYVTGNAQAVALIGVTDNTPNGTAVNFIKSDAGTRLTLIYCSNVTANSLAASTPITLVDTVGATQLLGLTVFGQANFQGNLGFYGTAGIAKPTVTGSKGANAALTSLMTALASLGLVVDSTT